MKRDMTRRELLKGAARAGIAAAGASYFLAWTPSGMRVLAAGADVGVAAATPLNPLALAKYVDRLPTVADIGLQEPDASGVFHVPMRQFQQKLHRDLPATTLWGYNGQFPGKTFLVTSALATGGSSTTVEWINDLRDSSGNFLTTYLIPGVYDPNLHGASLDRQTQTVVHLHGGHVSPAVDGFPEATFLPGQSVTYVYPNIQDAASLWYHDHALGQTRLNVYAGLAGLYLITDDFEKGLVSNNNLPTGDFDVPLVIQDKMFNTDGSLLYPISPLMGTPGHPGPWVPEFFGNVILINGKVWPFFEVEPRKYRLRIYNASNARFYNLKLKTLSGTGNLTFNQIAAEQGFFAATVQRTELLMGPAERADVIVDFAPFNGQTLRLTNNAKAPFPSGTTADPMTTGQIMELRVTKPLSSPDKVVIPTTLRPVTPLSTTLPARTMAFREYTDANDNPIIVLINGLLWEADPDQVKLGTTEIWELVNTTGDAHPMHLHLVRFQVVNRQKFNVSKYLAAWNPVTPGLGPTPPSVTPFLQGAPMLPDNNERGWKDTVRANPGEVLRIIATFDDFTGTYPWHCHIVEHEDNEMMRKFEVVP